MKWTFSVFLLFALLANGELPAQSKNLLWYKQPAEHFEESLVMGNGKMGASVFGGIHTDQIYLNDITLWTGEPVDPYMNPDAHTHIPSIRKALADENYRLADSLNHNVMGKASQSYAPLGTLYIDFHHEGEAVDYYRELDISNAVSKLNYTVEGTRYSREYFISHPDRVMVIKLGSDKQQSLDFTIRFESLLKYSVKTEKSQLLVDGYAPYNNKRNYTRGIPDTLMYDENRGTRFSSYFAVQPSGGTITRTDSSITVTGADEAVVLVSIATSFNGFDRDPAKEGLDNQANASDQLHSTGTKSHEELREAHQEDYRFFFDRVSLDLGKTGAPDLPTDERLKRYAEGAEDKNLEILYFQYGRYLLISSSRTRGVPANLQGIWNPYLRPPWRSNYTMNINVEENYWPAESTNLSELHMPYLSFIKNLSKTGSVTAKTFYGVDRGWASCHNSDIWAMSNPVGDFGQGRPVWACWNMSGTWAVTHLWEHYLFTGDLSFLESEAYPLMKGAAEFCLDWMVEDRQGYLITSPSTSPENRYLTPDGYRGATLYGSTSDLAMIRECFIQVIRASEILDTDEEFRTEVQTALDKLYPYQVGKKGNLQEWYHDWEDADPRHRHQSQLYGLHPGNHITPRGTLELAEACRVTLEIKGDETTGWSKGWRINLWARLLEGDRAYKMYRELLRYVPPTGPRNPGTGGGTYPNLMDAHPPFQIDGNFGGTAAVAEMLLQSTENEIVLLPALPEAWDEGQVNGLCARGGFEISMEWTGHEPVSVEILARNNSRTTLTFGNFTKEIHLGKGESLVIEDFEE